MKPIRCTLPISIFISTSVHVSGNYVPIIRKTYCIYATLAFLLSVWVAVWSAEQADILNSVFSIYIQWFVVRELILFS